MKLRANNTVERAGVNAARILFEAEGCVFQEIDLRNDYGKDAYVDRGAAGQVSGFCVALQIKSGESYRRASGYAIPLDGHERVWRASTLPMAGIVHDPRDGSLHWVNITEYLAQRPHEHVAVIPVPPEQLLNAPALGAYFWPSMRARPGVLRAGQAVLSIVTNDLELQQAALLDCFGSGRSDPRVLILVRRILSTLDGDSLRLAIRLLSFATPHPDVNWSEYNWIPSPVRETVRDSFRWSDDEVLTLIRSAEYEEWCRGGAGQNAFHLLAEDPDVPGKVERIVPRAFDIGEDAGSTALAVALHLAYDDAPEVYRRLVARDGRVRGIAGSDEVERILSEFGQIDIF